MMMSLVNNDVTDKQVSELPTVLLWDIGRKNKIFIMNISEDQSYEEFFFLFFSVKYLIKQACN